jgi:hypothetical protein
VLENPNGWMYMETMTVGRKLSVPMCQRAVCCRVHAQTEHHSKKRQRHRQQQLQIIQVHHPAILATNVYLDETGVIDMEVTKHAGGEVQFHNLLCWVTWEQKNYKKSSQHVVECIDGSTGYRVAQDTSDDTNAHIPSTSGISQVSSIALVQSFWDLCLFQRTEQMTAKLMPKSLTLLSELRNLKHEVAPTYEQAKTVLTTQHPIFRDWRRREYDSRIVHSEDNWKISS